MKRTKFGIICMAILIVAAFGDGFSVTPSIWKENTQQEFEKGSPEQVCITSEGEITLAPALEEVADVDALYVWALAQDREGNLYAGTGNEGKIFKIDAKGKSALLFDSPEVGIHSLALDRKGNLYAGSSPDGIVYRITPQGQASVFCHTGERYIWALCFGSDGALYAATGDQGNILKISSEGTSEEFFNSTDDHMMCLLADEEFLYAGSAGSGLIYVSCLGYGYLAVETVLIHELILYVGHPTYAVTVVIFSMLLFSGLGSILAGRLKAEHLVGKLRVVLVLVLLLGVVQAWGIPWFLTRYALGLPMLTRAVLTALVLAPLGLVMGMPFPLALRVLRPEAAGLVPWAWAFNGWTSVVASLTTVFVSRLLGYDQALAIAFFAYLVAALLAGRLARIHKGVAGPAGEAA